MSDRSMEDEIKKEVEDVRQLVEQNNDELGDGQLDDVSGGRFSFNRVAFAERNVLLNQRITNISRLVSVMQI